MTPDTLTELQITRSFTASAERVFDAWTDPKIVSKWLFTGPTSEHHETELDVRVGGKWTIVDRRDGTDYKALGEYLEVERPRRLAFTFGMPQFSPEFGLVTVDTVPAGTGCIMTLTQARLPAEAVTETEQGWSLMLDGLATILS